MRDERRGAVARQLRAIFDAGTAAGLTDGQLLERFATRRGEGAEWAFAALVERHGPMVLRVCRRALRDEHAAQDAFQATFLVLARRSAAIRRADSVASWLHGVALRVASCARAAEARRRRHEHAWAVARPAAMAVEPNDPGRALHEEVARLPERFRAPVVLCYLEGRSCDEAARLLACPVGTVKSRLATARDRLRDRLVRRGLAPATAVIAQALAAEAATSLPLPVVDSMVRAATLLAAGRVATAGTVPVGVAALTEGALKAMLFAKFKLVAPAVAVALLAVGAGVFARQAPTPVPIPGDAAPDAAAVPVAANTPAAPDADVVETATADDDQAPRSSREADRLRDLDAKLDRILNALGAAHDNAAPVGPRRITAPAARANVGRRGDPASVPATRADDDSRGDADRIADLERRLERVEREIQRINGRLGHGQGPDVPAAAAPAPPPAPPAPVGALPPAPVAPAAAPAPPRPPPPAPRIEPRPGATASPGADPTPVPAIPVRQ